MRFVHREMLEDVLEVSVSDLKQFHQEVLDLNVVVGPREAKPRASFERGAGSVIELADEALQIGGHSVSFPFTKPGWCLLGRAQVERSEPSLPNRVLENRRLVNPIHRRGPLTVREPTALQNQFHRWKKSASIP